MLVSFSRSGLSSDLKCSPHRSLPMLPTYLQEDMECPLCLEEIDLSDANFKPCPCGYQVSWLSVRLYILSALLTCA